MSLWEQSGYSAVFHFRGAGEFHDSLDSSQDGALSPGVTGAGINRGGALGYSLRFPGTQAASIEIGHTPAHQSDLADQSLSLELRFQLQEVGGLERFLIRKAGAYAVLADDTSTLSEARLTLASGDEVLAGSTVLGLNVWRFASLTVDAQSEELRYYLNGSPIGSTSYAGQGARALSSDVLAFGSGLAGFMDEARISNLARDADWYSLQALLQTATLQTLDDLEECPP